MCPVPGCDAGGLKMFVLITFIILCQFLSINTHRFSPPHLPNQNAPQNLNVFASLPLSRARNQLWRKGMHDYLIFYCRPLRRLPPQLVPGTREWQRGKNIEHHTRALDTCKPPGACKWLIWAISFNHTGSRHLTFPTRKRCLC
jgi:hypothetical protein